MELAMTQEFFNTLSPHKKLFFTLERAFDKDFAIAMLNLEYAERKRDILFKEAELKVLVENGSDEMMDELYTEAKKESEGKIGNAFTKVIDTIINFLKSIGETISSKVRAITAKLTEKNLTADQFEKSETMNLMLNMDYQKKMAEIDAQMTRGQKLIQQISQKTNVDEDAITGYCKACQKLRENTPKLVIKAGKVALGTGMVVIAYKNYGKVANQIVKFISGAEKKFSDFKSKLKGTENNVKQQQKVINEMQKLVKDFGMIGTNVITGISSICKVAIK